MTLPIEALETRRLLAFSPIQLGAKGYDSGYETAVDAAGNVVVAGVFQHTADFGTIAGKHIKLTAVGETDIFIAKYDAAGNLLWAGQIGGEESKIDKKPQLPIDPERAGGFVNRVGIQTEILGEYINGLALDASGNVFLTGTFLKTADFDPGAGQLILSANPKYGQYYDAYLEKLDPTGKLVWADVIGGQFNDVGNAVAVDPAGNPIVTGYFTRRADFDPTTKGDFSIDALGRDDIFVAKYTAAGGKLVWVDTFGGESTKLPERDAGNGITVDENGNILVTGTFADKVDFDPGPSVFLIKAKKHTDAFLMELSPRGKRVFVKTFGGKDYDGGVKVAARGGAIYTAGYFSGSLDLTIGKAAQTITSAGDDRHTDLLISKYSSTGSLIWAKQMGGEGFETIGGFGVAADGSVYTSGGFFDTADFDPGPGTVLLTSTLGDDNFDDGNDSGRDNSYDIYVSRLSTNGKYLSATRIGSSGDDFGAGLALNANGTSLTLTGQFRNTVPFDSASNTIKRKSRGSTDAFLIQLSVDLKLLS